MAVIPAVTSSAALAMGPALDDPLLQPIRTVLKGASS
jgi:hypothetical protein